jgi:hypothetical protein
LGLGEVADNLAQDVAGIVAGGIRQQAPRGTGESAALPTQADRRYCPAHSLKVLPILGDGVSRASVRFARIRIDFGYGECTAEVLAGAARCIDIRTGSRGMSRTINQKEHYARNNSVGYTYSSVARRNPFVATQPQLGLLPERRPWLGCGCCGCPRFDGQNLSKSILSRIWETIGTLFASNEATEAANAASVGVFVSFEPVTSVRKDFPGSAFQQAIRAWWALR